MGKLADFNILDVAAQRMAEQAHSNQKYGKWPYVRHLKEVRQVLERFGYIPSENMSEEVKIILLAAWLHDTLEDTALLKEHIEYDFGAAVADVVWRVSDEPGKTRLEKKLATYPKIKASKLALVVKLADRIANVEASLSMQSLGCVSLFKMYEKEKDSFKTHLYTPGEFEEMWTHLDSLFLKSPV